MRKVKSKKLGQWFTHKFSYEFKGSTHIMPLEIIETSPAYHKVAIINSKGKTEELRVEANWLYKDLKPIEYRSTLDKDCIKGTFGD
jgi:hypothetical protein